MPAEHTFVFEDDRVFAIAGGKVIAASEDVEELEEQLNNKPAEEDDEAEEPKKKATHIITPSGLKGKIVSRVEGLWSDEVTVRLENGNIAHYPVLANTEFTADDEQPELVTPVVALRNRLDADFNADRDSLNERITELSAIRREASSLIQRGASFDDTNALDEIAVTAAGETDELKGQLDYLDSEDAEAFVPPAPFNPQAVEQESMGGRGEWLDSTLNEMVQEAENFDYQKYMDEGPEAFVAELDDAPLAEQGTVQEMAMSAVRSKTAAADVSIREKYEGVWAKRVEEARRLEIDRRKKTAKKEAATQKDVHDDAPDESLFF